MCVYVCMLSLVIFDTNHSLIKVLCEQTRVGNKRIKYFFGLCLILFGFGNMVTDFHV